MRIRIGPFTLIHLSLLSLLFAVSFSENVDDLGFAANILFSSLLVASGLVLFACRLPTPTLGKICSDQRALGLLILVAVALVAYHYYVIGLPIFSEDIERTRFELMKSGLFGLPSRASIYTPPMLIWLSLLGDRLGLAPRMRVVWFGAGCLLLIFTGHKSALLTVFIAAAIVFPLVTEASKVYIRYFIAPLFLGAMLYGLFSFQKMTSLGSNLGDYVWQRFTDISIMPVYSAYNWSSADEGFASIFKEIFFPVSRIIIDGFDIFVIRLSRSIYLVPEGAFTVPVTPGFFAFHVGVIGVFYAYVFSAIFTVMYFLIVSSLYRDRNIFGIFSKSLMVYAFYIGFSTGNFYYAISNAAPFALLILVFKYKWRNK